MCPSLTRDTRITVSSCAGNAESFVDAQELPLHSGSGKVIDGIVHVMHGQSELLQIIRTLHSPCGFTGCLHCRQKKGNQHSDDCDDNKKFNESEGNSLLPQLFAF